MSTQPHQDQPLMMTGKPIDEATAGMILVHGRGATAQSILELASALPNEQMVYLAPQAANSTWYPYSFLAPLEQNEPGLSSGLAAVQQAFEQLVARGIAPERIVIGGFSQGACLASEFVARNAQKLGGLLVFSGGVIGPLGMERNYDGALDGTPIFIGCSDIDSHIPVERVEETAVIFKELGGQVNKKIYPNMGHTIIQDEIDQAMEIVKEIG